MIPETEGEVMRNGNGAGAGIQIVQEKITPARAERMLGKNIGNRNIRGVRVAQYARDMLEGRWFLSPQPLQFDVQGNLIDGQHRLLAVIKSGKTIEFFVARSVPDLVKTVIDTGIPRRMSDVLGYRGEANAFVLAATIRWCWAYERNLLRDPRMGSVSNGELLEWFEENPGIRESLTVAGAVGRRLRGVPPSLIAGIHFQASKVSPEDAGAFFEQLVSGVNLEEGSAILALRRWIERAAPRRDKPLPVVYAAMTIKALNYWREGRNVQTLIWRPGGATPEPFPKLLVLAGELA